MDYIELYKSEGCGSNFCSGVEIKISSPNGETENVKRVAYKAAELLEQAITRDFYANNQKAQEAAAAQTSALLDCFGDEKIFVRPIPNGYCGLACCEHLPWFEVTTRIGVIKIGWRKSVIQIDWSDSVIKKSAEELFPVAVVTKFEQTIHAWGYEKATEYLAVLSAIEAVGGEEKR